jgi:hypothetical protein
VRANAPIAALRVDGNAVPISRAARQVAFGLAAAKAQAAVSIEAESVDGRRATTTLSAGALAVDLHFPPPTGGKTEVPSRSTAAPLATSPYRK